MVTGTADGLLSEAEDAYSGVTTHPARYIALATDIIDRARKVPDYEALVVAMRALAWGRHAKFDNAGAKRLLDQAVRLAERHRLPRRLGEVLVSRAVALHELGRLADAMRDLRRAEPLVAPDQRPDLLMQLALLHHTRGRLTEAVGLYRRALGDPLCPPVIRVKAAINMSDAQIRLGQPRAALEHLVRAMEPARDLGGIVHAWVTHMLALASFNAGQVSEGMRRFEEAGALHVAAGVPLGEHYMDYSDALVDLRLDEEAAAVALLAADDFDRTGSRLMAAEARLRCARLALARGDIGRARSEADTALREFRRQRRAAWVARAAVVEVEASGFSYDALRRLRRAAATLERLGLRANAVEAHLVAGRAALMLERRAVARSHLLAAGRLSQGQPLLVRLRGRVASALLGPSPSVLRHCRAGLADLARHRAALPSVELRVLAAGHGAELGDLGLRALLSAGAPPARVLTWLERTRAASLLTVAPAVPEVEGEVLALRAVEQELKAAKRQRGEEPRELLARQSALEASIRRRSWALDHTGDPVLDLVSVNGLRHLLDGGWLVEYAAVDGRVVAVVLDPRRTTLVDLGPLDPVRREIDSVLFAQRRMLRGGKLLAQARATADEGIAVLAKLLVEPLGLPPGVPVVVVPSGPLLRVPWSPLVAAPVSVAPSATFWARGRGLGTPSRPALAQDSPTLPRVALVAGPGLPGAAREVAALRAIHPGATALAPPDSTVEATVDLVRGADLAHLACHGRLRSDNPLFSALELSDGALTLHEMFSRGVAPHRVIMAACDSGVERPYEGGEVLGFVSAMMARGTAGMVAAGLPVPDGASVAAMTALHEGTARGLPLSEALYEARSAVATEGPAEYVAWCTLTAYGAA
ncbi:CHAT domain-containing protein [Virgisporangium ochraceum]|uniref:CHAT domain-containing protein n=1 Tax=Virgisporangium ochraceum TaxID=65505 RepID=A0A8J3ZSR4_9ACTN|nr:CHAT domain-containing tetratricopeptide repeat protein [Virgisporangium ochraceum]GIJ68343.1 CHAT domain-containing protein [Virgisporangium ochraceum]